MSSKDNYSDLDKSLIMTECSVNWMKTLLIGRIDWKSYKSEFEDWFSCEFSAYWTWCKFNSDWSLLKLYKNWHYVDDQEKTEKRGVHLDSNAKVWGKTSIMKKYITWMMIISKEKLNMCTKRIISSAMINKRRTNTKRKEIKKPGLVIFKCQWLKMRNLYKKEVSDFVVQSSYFHQPLHWWMVSMCDY